MIDKRLKVLLIPSHSSKGTGGGIRVYNESVVDLFKGDKDINIELYSRLPNYSSLGNYYNYKILEKEILNINPDIIHVNGYTSKILKQIAKIARIHNKILAYTPHWHPFSTMNRPWLKKQFFNTYIKPYIPEIKGIICINKEELAFFSKISSKTNFIHHWNTTDYSDILGVKKNSIPNRILFVGRLNDQNKGLEHVLKFPIGEFDIHCVGVGNVPRRSDLTQHIQISHEDLIKLYMSSSLVVVPSRYEAFSYVSMEALCLGIPVVMSDRVKIADVLSEKNGYDVFKYSDYEEFLSKVRCLIGTKFDNSQYLRLFSKEEAHKKYKEFYHKLIRNEE